MLGGQTNHGLQFCFSLSLHASGSDFRFYGSSDLELVALLNLSSWCLVMVEWLFLAVPWGCLRFVIVVFPDHTHLLFLKSYILMRW